MLFINFCCIYRGISRIFLSLNMVAQVGLRQEFKNVLLNHLNNSEVSEGESGVVSSKKLSTEPKICAKSDKNMSQFLSFPDTHIVTRTEQCSDF